MEEYNVSMAEIMIPSADISEQISLAGKEASGTGCMKLMMNGALTLGTLDGANVEILEAVGLDNIYIFGLNTGEVEELWRNGYSASTFYHDNARLKRAVESLSVGFNGESFHDIANYLLMASPVADPYMCLADFSAYCDAQKAVSTQYADRMLWAKKSLHNIANAGIFAADRSIDDYAKNIWNLKPLNGEWKK